jgi:hypothetical protein
VYVEQSYGFQIVELSLRYVDVQSHRWLPTFQDSIHVVSLVQVADKDTMFFRTVGNNSQNKTAS